MDIVEMQDKTGEYLCLGDGRLPNPLAGSGCNAEPGGVDGDQDQGEQDDRRKKNTKDQ